MDLRDAANDLPDARHRHGSIEPRTAHVADRNHDATVCEHERVVPVSAHLRFVHAGAIERTKGQSRHARQLAR